MSAEDDSALLPSPPPPRPAAREAAIGMALRRFDGVTDPPAAKAQPARTSWTRKPQFGLLLTASLVVVIGLPGAMIALRNSDFDQPAKTAAPPPALEAHPERAVPNLSAPPVTPAPLTQTTEEPRVAPQLHRRDVPMVGSAEARREEQAPAAAVVAAAPPPPPPPPAPAPVMADNRATDATADSIVVTGGLVQAPKVAKRTAPTAESEKAFAVQGGVADASYAPFLLRLQDAVRADDRNAIVKLMAFPLRVNSGGRSRLYPDARAVRTDYEQIFTQRVKAAILSQRADRLFVRDLGAMIGNGELWFDRTCADRACSQPGPVRIKAVNP